MNRGCSYLSYTLACFVIIVGIFGWIVYPAFLGRSLKPEDTEWPKSLQLINREVWGDKEIANPETIVPMNGIKYITIHHDGMPPLPMVTEGQIKSRIVAIRESHSGKFSDIAYHFVIDPLGRVWEARPLDYQGAHVQNHNEHNVGLLFLGNTLEDVPTEAGLRGLYSLVQYLMQRYSVSEANVKTHQEYAQTGCPGKMLQQCIDEARKKGVFKVKAPEHSDYYIDELRETLKSFFGKAKERFSKS